MKNQLLRDSMIIGVSGIVASVADYAFLVLLGKALTPEEFGVFGLILSSMLILSMVMSVFNVMVIQYISYFLSKSQNEKASSFSRKSMLALLIGGIILLGLFQLYPNKISHLFNFPSDTSGLLIRLLGVFFFANIISTGLFGILNGLQKFTAIGVIRIIQAFSTLAVTALLINAHFGVLSSIGGLIFGGLIIIPLCIMVLGLSFFSKSVSIGKVGLWSYLSIALPVSIALGFLLNFDVILAKAFLSPQDAGFYAAASIFGFAIFFVTGTITRVMFPKVADMRSNGEDSISLLKESLIFTIAITGILTLIVTVFPEFVSRMVFGQRYQIANLVRWYAPALFFLGICVVIIMYKLATKSVSVIAPTIAAAVMKFFLVIIFHESALQIAQSVFYFHLLLMVGLAVMYKDDLIRSFRSRKEFFGYPDLLQLPGIKRY